VPHVTSRALRVPADRRAPAAARDAVRAVLAESHLDDLLDDALLLATELTTNAVIHVGADIEIRVEASDDGSVTVSIRDSEPGELPQLGAVDAEAYPFANTGRGLMLVDRIAYRWGTTADAGGKAVWFQLHRAEFVDADTVEWATEEPAAGFITWLRKRLSRQVAGA
jgi:phosphoserine phosphatase RsbU/P